MAFIVLMFITLFCMVPNLSLAAQSDWLEALGGKIRLISGGELKGRYKAGLEIRLDEGWKTYWKIPGDSGIPPMLDSEASSNVAQIDILWPVPSRIKVGGSDILGYKDAIIFPILVTPANKEQQTKLNVSVQLGLCSDLCVPMAADLTLDIAPGGERAPGAELLIDRDIALVPKASSDQFRITALDHLKGEGGTPDRLLITTRIPDGYGKKDLFVEGPEDWLLPLTVRQQGDEDKEPQFVLMLDGLPKGGQSKGTDLHFTLTNGEEAVEQTIQLQK